MKKWIAWTGLWLAMSANAHASFFSNEGRGGGDNVALEFQQALASAVAELQPYPQIRQVLADHAILETSLKANIVVVDDALDLNVKNLLQNSVAINIPAQQTILINRKRWNKIEDVRTKNAIALHEVLSLKNIERTGYYPISSKYIILVGGKMESLSASTPVLSQFPNREEGRGLFLAGSTYYTTVKPYLLGQPVPVSSTSGRTKAIAVLQDLCLKNTNTLLDEKTFTYEYGNGTSNAGADLGDVLFHPIQSATQLQVSIEASAKCLDNRTNDGAIVALKNDPNLFSATKGDDDILELYPNEMTLRVAFYEWTQEGQTSKLAPQEMPSLKVVFTSTNIFNHTKTLPLSTTVAEVNDNGDLYVKLNISALRPHLSSWKTNQELNFQVNGQTYKPFYYHPAVWDYRPWNQTNPNKILTGPYRKEHYALIRTNQKAGVMDIKIYLRK